ncbi:HNH endonuclease family protein [Mycolicibacter minnesotensis]
MKLSKRARIALIAAPVVALAIVGIATATEKTSIASTEATSGPPATERALAPAGPALDKLNALDIKGRAPKTGFDRALFGTAWTDDVTVAGGHNGCDTRNDMLRRDLTDAVLKPGRKACVVLSGTLNDPYTGETVQFQRGPGSSSQVQVDHVVPLLDAWQKGAQNWDHLTRRNFANDPINLQSTTGAANRAKGAGDAATWLPPNKAYRCSYATRIIDVKATYGLWVTQAERDALARVLAEHC